jgi:hypothetical protein
MLLRISLVIAIIAALAVGVLNFVMVKEKLEKTEAHRAEEEKAKVEALGKLAATEKTLEKTTADLKQTEETLVATKAERDRFQAEATAQFKKAADLTKQLSTTTTERDDARANLAAYVATGYTPQQILAFDKQLKQVQAGLETATVENKVLALKADDLQNQLNELTQQDWRPPPLPASLRGKVLVSDPKWDFVILDVGLDQGVFKKGEVLVSRNGKLVAKLSIRSVEKTRCVANVLPGWKLGDVMEGDQILPAS